MERRHHRERVIGIRYPAWSSYGPGMMKGAVDYMDHAKNWRLVTENNSAGELEAIKIDENWEGDGLILFRATEAELRSFKKRGIAVVLTSSEGPDGGYPRVLPDNEAAGRAAALHLIELKLSRFAFIGRSETIYQEEQFASGSRTYSKQRLAGYRSQLEDYSFTPHFHFLKGQPLWEPDSWRKIQAETMAFLKTLPEPCGLFVADDSLGAVVIRAAQALQIKVPQKLAVIGYGDDPVFCYAARPSMSSIAHPAKNIGFHAAELLDRQLAGENLDNLIQALPIKGVVPRASSDILAIQDPLIRDLVMWIRRRAPFDSIRVTELVERCPFSLTTLKERFAKELGCSPKQEIKRIRLAHLKHVIETTQLEFPKIAANMKFSSTRELIRFFTSETGTHPTQHRLDAKEK